MLACQTKQFLKLKSLQCHISSKAAINETWLLNIATNTMTQGPSLNTARYFHGCVRVKDDSIIVVGGYTGYTGYDYTDILKSTEILKIGDLEWTNGPDLEVGVRNNEVVSSYGEDYIAYNMGGYNVLGL